MELLDEIHQFLNDPNREDESEFDGKLITKKQVDTLIEVFLQTRGPENSTLEDSIRVVRWGERAVLDFTLFELIQKGLLTININDEDEFVFATPGELVDN